MKNATSRAPATRGERNWKQAKRFDSKMNNSQAVVMLFDDDEASETVLWSNARGPNTGIMADWKW